MCLQASRIRVIRIRVISNEFLLFEQLDDLFLFQKNMITATLSCY
jgi:hypothetical protein